MKSLPPAPGGRYTIAIFEEGGRVLRRVEVSERTAKKIAELVDGTGAVAGAVLDLVGAARSISDTLDTLTRPQRRISSRGRR